MPNQNIKKYTSIKFNRKYKRFKPKWLLQRLEGLHSMELAPLEFPDKNSTSSTEIKRNNQGFMLALLIPFISLIMTGFLSFSFLSVSIKNISKSQKICILENLSLQKDLKKSLTKILSLNQPVKILHYKRKALEKSLQAAIGLGLFKLIPLLKKQIYWVKLKQKILQFKQKRVWAEAHIKKIKSLTSLKSSLKSKAIHSVRDQTLLKKPLALFEKKLSPQASIYKPLEDFSKKQKTIFSWKMNSLYPLKKSKPSSYRCIATLERRHHQWKERLFH